MATVETIELSGQDETIKVPQTGLNVTLPPPSDTCSSMVTIERIAGNKWEAPQHMNKLVTSNTKYIAYTVQVHEQHMMKVVTLDNSSKTVIKGIGGLVYDVMFKDVNQDTLAILSMEEGTLNLYVYSILVNLHDKLDHELIIHHMFYPNDSTRPVLAFYPGDEDTTFLALALNTTIHTVALDDVDETVVQCNPLKHTALVTGVCITEAGEGEMIIATCSEDGSIFIHNPATQDILQEFSPFQALQPPSTEPILWMQFADNLHDPDATRWRYLVAATVDKVAVINCHDDWTINHHITFISRETPLTRDVRYQIDPSGRFLVIAPLHDPFFYIIELDTEGDFAYFTQLACYPLARSLYDVTVKRVITEESVQSRFSDGSIRHNLHLIGVNNQAIQGMNAIFEPVPALNTSRGSAASSLKGSTSSSVKASSSRSLNTSQQEAPILLGPSAFSATSSPSRSSPQTPLTPSALHTPLTPATLHTPLTPSALHTPLTLAADYRASTDYAPLHVPVSQPFSKAPLANAELMPTPLPTPDTMSQPLDTAAFHSEDNISDPVCHSEPTSDGVDQICEFRKCEDVEVLTLLNGVFIPDCDEVSVNECEADLISTLDNLHSVEDEEFSAAFIEFYQSRAQSASSAVAQLCSKYLLIHSYNCTDAIVTINKALAGTSFVSNFNIMLCESVNEFLVNYRQDVFSNLQETVRRLYNNETFLHHDMLVLLEKLVKSHFDCEDVYSEAWCQTLIHNLKILLEDIRLKDASDHPQFEFLAKVKNVLEPLQDQLSDALEGIGSNSYTPAYQAVDMPAYQSSESTLTYQAESTYQSSESTYKPSESSYQGENTASDLGRSSSILLGMLKNNSQLGQAQPNINEMLDNAAHAEYPAPLVDYDSPREERFESPVAEIAVSDVESNPDSAKSNTGYHSDVSGTSETYSSVQSETFPAQDIRYKNMNQLQPPPTQKLTKEERHKLGSIDELKQAVNNLKKNNEGIRKIQPARHKDINISQTVKDRLSRTNNQSKQINSCVDAFYNFVLKNLDKDIERWFDEVVHMFRDSFRKSFDNKQKKLHFRVDHKEMDKSVSKIVKEVRSTVAECISSATAEQDLRHEIQRTILPSFQAMLGQTFKQIEASVSKEFNSHGKTLAQMKRDSRQDEQALLAHLAAIERSVQQLETLRAQQQQHLVTMETRLNTALTDLYTRHGQR